MNAFRVSVLGVAALVGLAGQVARGEAIAIENASFENAAGWNQQTTGTSSWGGLPVSSGYLTSNFTNTGTNVTSIAGAFGVSASTGTSNVLVSGVANATGANFGALKLALVLGSGTTVTGGTVTEWLNSTSLGTFAANTTYTLTAALSIDIYAGSSAANCYTDIGIGLAADGTLAASNVVNAFTLARKDFLNGDRSVVLSTAEHPEYVGKAITIRLINQRREGGNAANVFALYDNVRLDATAIQEPPTTQPASAPATQPKK